MGHDRVASIAFASLTVIALATIAGFILSAVRGQDAWYRLGEVVVTILPILTFLLGLGLARVWHWR